MADSSTCEAMGSSAFTPGDVRCARSVLRPCEQYDTIGFLVTSSVRGSIDERFPLERRARVDLVGLHVVVAQNALIAA